MENWAINLLSFLGCFFGMELVAWFTHKYIMHGFAWFLHQDHHLKGEGQVFERNDTFFLVFATPGIILLAIGWFKGWSQPYPWMGLGITAYGLAYFLIHDIFIHRRFSLFRNSENKYLLGIRRAHKMHHKKITKEGGECFGMLWVPFKYLRNK